MIKSLYYLLKHSGCRFYLNIHWILLFKICNVITLKFWVFKVLKINNDLTRRFTKKSLGSVVDFMSSKNGLLNYSSQSFPQVRSDFVLVLNSERIFVEYEKYFLVTCSRRSCERDEETKWRSQHRIQPSSNLIRLASEYNFYLNNSFAIIQFWQLGCSSTHQLVHQWYAQFLPFFSLTPKQRQP